MSGGIPDYRLFFDVELQNALAATFVMSNLRFLEERLRRAAGEATSVHVDAPFWEFVDIEFDREHRRFDLHAHYLQRPTFPLLFEQLALSPPLRRVRRDLDGRSSDRILKQEWRERSRFELEIGATNVVYMLADTADRTLYVGEAVDLVSRLRAGHPGISRWTHYRYDLLPHSLSHLRLELERMLIRDVEALLAVPPNGLPGAPLSDYRLTNLRIDR